MKKMTLKVMSLLGAAVMAVSVGLQQGSIASEKAEGKEWEVKTSGMTCGDCVAKVNSELAKIKDQLKGITVEVEVNEATIKLDPKMTSADKTSVVKAVEKAVTDAGFKIVSSQES